MRFRDVPLVWRILMFLGWIVLGNLVMYWIYITSPIEIFDYLNSNLGNFAITFYEFGLTFGIFLQHFIFPKEESK